MKRSIFLLFCLILTASFSHAKKLRPMFNHAVFQTPDGNPYLETYLSIIGHSVHFEEIRDGVYQGAVSVTLTISSNDTIRYADKIRLKSPETTDTLAQVPNFLHQDRIPLPNGVYSVFLSVSDANSTKPPLEVVLPVTINMPQNKVAISDINFLESYKKSTKPSTITKAGYDLLVEVPYGDYFFPSSKSQLNFYAEVYNIEEVLKDVALVRYFIETSDTEHKISQFVHSEKVQPKSVNVFLNGFDISELPSGNYHLVFKVFNRNLEEIASKKVFFHRSNPQTQLALKDIQAVSIENSFATQYDNLEDMSLYIRSLYPIADAAEQQYAANQLKGQNLDEMQRFFHGFWMNRNYYNPEKAWAEYLEQLKQADDLFSTPQFRGFETDRGRVFLKYGPPSDVDNREYEPSAYPYQIWYYYNLGAQTNRLFVFGNFELASNEYKLIHSNAIGEINNPQWKVMLNKRNNQMGNPDQTNVRDQFGSWLNDNDRDFQTPTGPQ